MDNLQNLTPHPTLIFFSGLGADSKLFAMQKKRFPDLIAPDWLIPQAGESLDDYIERWLGQLDVSGNVIVGGVSFGGLIAQRVAKQIGARHCLLFGSIKLRSEVPRRLRWVRPLHYLAYRWIIRFWQIVVTGVVAGTGRFLTPSTRTLLRQFSRLDPYLVQWSLKQLYFCFDQLPIVNEPTQEPIPLRSCPGDHSTRQPDQQPALQIDQIHGAKDRVFPASRIQQHPDTTIHLLPQAGHLLTLFESGAVNEIIERIVEAQSEGNEIQNTIGSSLTTSSTSTE